MKRTYNPAKMPGGSNAKRTYNRPREIVKKPKEVIEVKKAEKPKIKKKK